MAQSYESLLKNFDKVKGVSFNERVWRAVPDRYNDDIWNITDHTRRASHRYSQPGDSALYTSLGNEDLGRWTIMAELRRQDLNGYHFASTMKAYDNVLDLTNLRVLDELGIEKDLIVKTDGVNFYELTHQIGNISRLKGYTAVIAPSARTRGFEGINFIIFGD